MPFPNEHAARQNDPGKYRKFRRESDKFGKGIDAIWGITQDGTVELQSIRFNSHLHSPEQAKKWLKDNKMKMDLEKASGSNMSELATDLMTNFDSIDKIEILNQFDNDQGIKFSDEDFKGIIQNFNDYKDVYHPNVKISHSEQQFILKKLFDEQGIQMGEELPALGYIDRIWQEGKSLYADIKQIPSKLKFLFTDKIYKTISPELIKNFRDTGRWVMKAIVLTNNPSQKHVTDVHMSEALGYQGCVNILKEEAYKMADENNDVQVTTFAEKVWNILTGKKAEEDKKKAEADAAALLKQKEGTGSPDMLALSEVQTLVQAAVQKETNDLKLKLMEKDGEAKKFSEQLKKIQDEGRMEKAEAICEKARLSGVPPVVIEHFKPVLLSELGEKTIKLSEVIDGKTVEAEKSMMAVIKDFFEKYPNKVKFGEQGKTKTIQPGDDDSKKKEQIVKLTEEYKKQGMEHHVALEKAMIEVLAKEGN